MKTLQEIKDEYAVNIGFDDWISLYRITGYYNEDIFFMHENKVFELIQKEQQKLIAENAKVKTYKHFEESLSMIYTVDESSIINENNIIR